MAVLSYQDILKRNNVENFTRRINSAGSFNYLKEGGDILVCTGKVRVKFLSNPIETLNNLNEDSLKTFLNSKGPSDYIEVECKGNTGTQFYKVSSFFKDKEFGGVAGKSSGGGAERQELGLINILNENAHKGNFYYVDSFGKNNKILRAYKNDGLSQVGQEPYIDIFIETTDKKNYGISMKGEQAPSLAGGGIAGLKVVVPDLLPKIYKEIEKYLKTRGLGEGSIVNASLIPDFYVEIPSKYIKQILIGNVRMGGPVDYMYIGKMDVKATVNDTTGEIKPNGTFYDIDQYMRKVGKFYFRIRKRDLPSDNMIEISFKNKNKEGYPIVFMTPKSKKNNFRIVIIDKLSGKGVTLNIQ
jgi:hypothetical protein